MKKLLLIALPLFLMGCACPEKAIYRESVDGNMTPIIRDWREWAPLITATPNHPQGQLDKIRLLTPNQLQNGQNTINEYEKLRDEDRARDKKGFMQ